MAWARATIQIKPASVGTGIKCQLRRTKKLPASLTLFVRESIATDLQIADGNGLEVLIGEGEHHGLIRFRKNNSAIDGAKAELRSSGKGNFFQVKLGHQPAFVDRSEAGSWCQWEKVEDGWVEIVLPKWADETGPKARKAAVVTREHKNEPPDQRTGPRTTEAQPMARQTTAKQNVTSAIMGDPPPGRREMLAKFGEMKV